MIDAGIDDGDLLLIDEAEQDPVHGRIILADLDGIKTVKRLRIASDGTKILKSENPKYEDIVIGQGPKCVIQGTVVGVIRSIRR